MKIVNRYERNFLSEKEQKTLLNTRVLIAGCGGLGASVITNLASIGVGNIVLLDFDKVEETNFNRQFIHTEKNLGKLKTFSAKEFIENYNSDINVDVVNERLTIDNAFRIIENYDCILDCLDNWESKFLLNKICTTKKIPLVHGGVEKTYGQVFSILPEGACLECFVENSKQSVDKKILAPVVNLMGSLMADECLKILLKEKKDFSEILMYDFSRTEFKKIRVNKNKKCKVCNNI